MLFSQRHRSRAFGIAIRAAVLLVTAAPCLFAAPSTALADDAAKTAKERFREGRDAFKQKDFARALSLFEESQRLVPAAGTLLNLALCEAALGRNVAALSHFQKLGADLPAGDDRRTLVDEQLAALGKKVAMLRLALAPDAPQEATVLLDGEARDKASLGVDLPLDPGAHTVIVRAEGRPDKRYSVDTAPGKQTVLVVDAAPASAAKEKTAPTPAVTPSTTSPLEITGWVAGGVGIAGAGVGAAMGFLAIEKKDQVGRLCPVPAQCTEEGVAIEKTGKLYADVSTIAVIAGAALAAGGLTMVIVGRSRKPAVAAGTVAVVPLPGGAGMVLNGRF